MFAQAFSLYRRRFCALVFTAAFAILPASLLEGGAIKAGFSRLYFDAGPAPELPQLGGPQTRYSVPQTEPAHLLDAVRAVLPFAYGTFLSVLLLAAGATLALAALTPFAEGDPTPAEAWTHALRKLGPLFGTALLAGLIVAAGALCFVIPGIILAVGLAFSVPIVMSEDRTGFAALHRSWQLVKPQWPFVLLVLFTLCISSAIATLAAHLAGDGPQALLVAAGIRVLTWPLPLLALAGAYERAVPGRARPATSN